MDGSQEQVQATKYQRKRITETYDVVVCGGGLAGFCAAISAARQGINTCIIQDRPVFGGNSSSEIRVKPLGADRYHVYARETGIISELLIAERATNHSELFGDNGAINSVWDMLLYDLAVTTPNLSLHLNTRIINVNKTADDMIASVVGVVANAETEITVCGKLFIDSTGDGVVAAMAGCEWRIGEESRTEFNEPHAPLEASADTMGNSLHFTTKDMGRPIPYTPPSWAIKHEDPDFFYETGRVPYNQKGGYWWLEIAKPWHTIYDNEQIRHELTCHLLGVWDWVKNKDPRLKHLAANWALDWVGQVPGKRESRRIIGLYLMTEHDIVENPHFYDEVGFGGFFVDLHAIGGLRATVSEPTNAEGSKKGGAGEKSEAAIQSYVPPYGFPLRMLLAKSIKNLMMAGRNVSVTHVALGTLRVMSTTALMGQAAGVAAAVAIESGLLIQDIPEIAIHDVQQRLLKDGCFLPHVKNEDQHDLARKACVSASSSAKVSGIGPGSSNWINDHFEFMKSQPVVLKQRVAQWIAIGENRLDTISVCLNNHSSMIQQVKATLMPATHIWDYNDRDGVYPIAETTLNVQPGKLQWIDWNLDRGQTPGTYVRLDLGQNENLSWQSAGTILPGHMCAYEIAPGRLRKYKQGLTMSFKVSPAQSVFNPDNVQSGVTRPHTFTNLWRSDPEKPLPEWFQLEWQQPQLIREIQITWAGNFLFEYGNYPPQYKDGEVAKDYSIAAYIDSGWVTIVSAEDNYQPRCNHPLGEPISTKKLKINIYSTNGDLAAGIYEIRCY